MDQRTVSVGLAPGGEVRCVGLRTTCAWTANPTPHNMCLLTGEQRPSPSPQETPRVESENCILIVVSTVFSIPGPR